MNCSCSLARNVVIGCMLLICGYANASWQRINPTLEGDNLFGIWGRAEDDIYLTSASAILHWNGVSLEPVFVEKIAGILDIYGFSQNCIFAVGNQGEILHWNGITWKRMPSGVQSDLYGVWGTSPENVFAVGLDGVILHFNGSSWQPMTSGTTAGLMRVWGFSETSVYAVGETGTILHFDGINWSAIEFGFDQKFTDIWGMSENDLYVAGFFDTPRILHFDGTTWYLEDLQVDGFVNFLNVAGSSRDDIYLTGTQGRILHFDGSAWSEMESNATCRFYGIQLFDSGHVAAIGDGGAFIQYDGTNWVSLSPGIREFFKDIYVASPETIYVAGGRAGLLKSTGSQLSEIKLTFDDDLNATCMLSSTEAYCAGQNGAIFGFDGTNWLPMTSGTTSTIRDLFGVAPGIVVAVGDNGSILRLNNGIWESEESGVTDNLLSVTGAGTDNLFAAGEAGVILHYDGSVWVQLTSNTVIDLTGLWMAEPDSVYAVGASRTDRGYSSVVLHWNGTVWSEVLSRDDVWLTDIWGSSESDIYAVGVMESYHYDGTIWSSFDQLQGLGIDHILGFANDDILLFSEYGYLLHWNGTDLSVMTTLPSSVYPLNNIHGLAHDHLITCSDCGVIAQYDGSEWHVDNECIEEIDSVFGYSVDDVYVADRWMISHWNGTDWTELLKEKDLDLRELWGLETGIVYAIDADGFVHKWDGVAWQVSAVGQVDLTGIWGLSETDLFVLAGGGRIMHFDGVGWSLYTERLDSRLTCIIGFGPDDIYVAGGNNETGSGRVYHFDGVTWDLVLEIPGNYFQDLWGSASDDVYVAGEFGQVFRFDGVSWRNLLCPSSNSLIQADGIPDQGVWFCGWEGTVIRYQPTEPDVLGVQIEMSSEMVHPGDEFRVRGTVRNPGDLDPDNLPLYFILDIHGAMYFWPSWVGYNPPESNEFDYEPGYVGVGLQRIDIFPSFIWPDTGAASDSGLWFYGAILDAGQTTILGDYAAVEWGFGP